MSNCIFLRTMCFLELTTSFAVSFIHIFIVVVLIIVTVQLFSGRRNKYSIDTERKPSNRD